MMMMMVATINLLLHERARLFIERSTQNA